MTSIFNRGLPRSFSSPQLVRSFSGGEALAAASSSPWCFAPDLDRYFRLFFFDHADFGSSESYPAAAGPLRPGAASAARIFEERVQARLVARPRDLRLQRR